MILGDEFIWATGYGQRRHLFDLAKRKTLLTAFESYPAWCGSGENYVALDFFADIPHQRERVMKREACKRCAKGLRAMQVDRGEMPPLPYEPGYDSETGRFITAASDQFGWGHTWLALTVHTKDDCLLPEACCIHNPSDHVMKDWPTFWRQDRMLMERICRHGTGHPDPDDIAFKVAIDPDRGEWESVHGCDGCCMSDEELAATGLPRRA